MIPLCSIPLLSSVKGAIQVLKVVVATFEVGFTVSVIVCEDMLAALDSRPPEQEIIFSLTACRCVIDVIGAKPYEYPFAMCSSTVPLKILSRSREDLTIKPIPFGEILSTFLKTPTTS